MAFGFNAGTLGDQVVHVWRPVLNGGVRDVRAWLNNDFDNCRVQCVVGVHRCRATFDVVNFGTLVGDDERALELTGRVAVDAEVGLQWHFAFDAWWNIDE